MPKIAAQNRKAYHDYFVEEKYEAGISLAGTEVKSIRQGAVNLKDSYCQTNGKEIFVHGMHISPYEKGNIFNKDPLRTRKLLLHKHEINKLFGLIQQQGISLIPTCAYFIGSKVKIELGIGKGKKLYDKREDLKKKDTEMYLKRLMKK